MLCTWGYIRRVSRSCSGQRLSRNFSSPGSPTSIPGSSSFTFLRFRAQATTSSFSSGLTEQVLQTRVPPGLRQSIAARISSFCRCECLQMSIICLPAFIEGSLAIMPRPVQGASSSTRSHPRKCDGIFRPSQFVTIAFVQPMRCRLNCKALSRYFLLSLAQTTPEFFISWQMWVVLPPGAAAMSSTLSPACGASAITGSRLDALCSMQWPARYSGVAPKGTLLSYTLMPTLLHSATGSSETPLPMSTWASSLRLTLRLLERRVTGRGVSLASRNCSSSCGAMKHWKCAINSSLQPQYPQNRAFSREVQYFLGLLPNVLKSSRMFSTSFIQRLTFCRSVRSTLPTSSPYQPPSPASYPYQPSWPSPPSYSTWFSSSYSQT